MKLVWKKYPYAMVLLMLSLVTAFILSIRFDSFHKDHFVKVTVSEGDSLYKIAAEYSEKGSFSSDEFVQWVQRHNNIDGDHIFPGEKILIPVSNEKNTDTELASAVE